MKNMKKLDLILIFQILTFTVCSILLIVIFEAPDLIFSIVSVLGPFVTALLVAFFMAGYGLTIYCYFIYGENMRNAAKAKDVFIASISHEIKTPLNAIFGAVQLLERTELTKEQFDIVNKLNLSAGLMLNIVKDILDFSKIKYNQYSLYPENISLIKLMNSVENMTIPMISDKGLAFEK